MRSLLMDADIRYISGPLLQQLDLDLQECESEFNVDCCVVYSFTFVSYWWNVCDTQTAAAAASTTITIPAPIFTVPINSVTIRIL